MPGIWQQPLALINKNRGRERNWKKQIRGPLSTIKAKQSFLLLSFFFCKLVKSHLGSKDDTLALLTASSFQFFSPLSKYSWRKGGMYLALQRCGIYIKACKHGLLPGLLVFLFGRIFLSVFQQNASAFIRTSVFLFFFFSCPGELKKFF